jgi:hypothetical protein
VHANSPVSSTFASLTRTTRGRGAVAALLALGLVAGACSNGADEGGGPAAPEPTFERADGTSLRFEEPVATVADLLPPAAEGEAWTIAGSVFDPGTSTSVATTWSSPDGRAWERADVRPADSDVSEAFAAMAPAEGGRLAVGWAGDGAASDAAVWREADGEWQQVEGAAGVMGGEHEQWAFDVAVSPERGMVVAGGESTWGEVRARVWFSGDGETWEAVDGGPGGVFDATGQESVREVAAVPDGFVAVGSRTDDNDQDAVVWFSEDGRSWEEVEATGLGGEGRQAMLGVNAQGGVIVAGGYTSGADGQSQPVVWRSPDGRSWDSASAPLPGITDDRTAAGGLTVRSIEPDGEGLIAVGGADWRPHVWRSTDGGVSWGLLPNPTAADLFEDGVALETAASFDGTVIALGLEPTVMRLDGDRWADATGDAFPTGGVQPFATSVTVGEQGEVVAGGRYSSPRADARERYIGEVWHRGDDGWTAIESENLQAGQIMDVTAFAGGYAAVGFEDFGLADQRTAGDSSPDGLIWTSPDGNEWNRIAAETPEIPMEMLEVFADSESEDVAGTIASLEASMPAETKAPAGGPGTRSLEAVAPLGDGFIAVGVACCDDPGEPIVVVSADGTDIAGEDSGLGGPGTQRYRDVCVGPDGTAVAVGISGTDGAYDAAIRRRAPDGAWTAGEVGDGSFGGPGSQQVYGCAAGEDGFVAVGSDDASGDSDARVWTSTDGVAWRRIQSGVLGGSGDQWASAAAMVPGDTGGWLIGGTDTAPGDGDIALWRLVDGELSRRDEGEPELAGPGEQSVTSLLVEEDGVTIVGDDYGRVGLWQSDVLDR